MMRRIALIAFAAGCVWLAAGCASSKKPLDYKPTVARFFLEAPSGDGTPVKLPQSGVHLALNSKPVLTEGDFSAIELVQVDLGKCVMFQLSASATRDFYRMTVTHQNRRLVLVIDGVAVGARRIDGPITNGVVFVFVEMPEADLPALVSDLKKSTLAIQKEIARKG